MSRNVSNVFHNVQNDYTDNIPDDDAQLHPAGRHVPQTSGEPSQGIPAWIESNPNADLTNTDVVLWQKISRSCLLSL
jgi:Cu2+-containing amine oxidase